MPVYEPLEPAEPSLGADAVKNLALSGVKVMSARTAGSFVLRIISSLVLARLLFPKDYGAFALVGGITGIAMYLCDIGLSGALMRQHSEPTEEENTTVFFGQQALTAVIVACLIAVSPWLVRVYKMPADGRPLLIAMALSLFLSSLRIIPMLSMERALRFVDIARCELIENIVQVLSTIVLARLGMGAWSMAGGAILRGLAGLACVWTASPWRPRGRFDLAIVKRLALYGIPLQLNYVVPSLAGSWHTFVISRLLGVAAVGFVGWAMNLASVPMMFAGVLNRVAFPAYSRLQSSPAILDRYLRESVKRLLALCCVAVPPAVIFCPFLLPLLFRRRWAPAVPLVQWLILESAVSMVLIVLCAAQNAMGYAADRLCVTIVMTGFRWAVGYACVIRFGLAGVGPAMLGMTVFELLLTVALMIARNRRLAGIAAAIFVPMTGIGAILAAATLFGRSLAQQGVLLQEAGTMSLFVACMLLWERASKDGVVGKDLRRLILSVTETARERPA